MLLKARTALSQTKVIYSLSCKGKLCNDVFSVIKIAIEGIVFCGNVHAVEGLDMGEIVFYVEAVDLQGHTLDAVVLAAVVTLQNEAVFGVVGEDGFA